MRCAVHMTRTWEKRNAQRVSVAIPEGKRPIGSSGSTKDYIKAYLKEKG